MKLIRFYAFASLVLATILPLPTLAERSPIFGSAAIEAISREAARDITARGELANYFGGLAVSFSYSAYVFAFYARYYAPNNSALEQSWYGAAAWYAYHAHIYAAWAQAYSAAGM